MISATHHIKREILDFGFASKASAMEWERIFEMKHQKEFSRVIAAVLDRYDDGMVRYIDKLDISLGRITDANLTTQLGKALHLAVRKELGQHEPAGTSPGKPGSLERAAGKAPETGKAHLSHLFRFFLSNGFLPWNSDIASLPELERRWSSQYPIPHTAFDPELRKVLKDFHAIKRLYQQFSKTFAKRIIKAYLGEEVHMLQLLGHLLEKAIRATAGGGASIGAIATPGKDEVIAWIAAHGADSTLEWLNHLAGRLPGRNKWGAPGNQPLFRDRRISEITALRGRSKVGTEEMLSSILREVLDSEFSQHPMGGDTLMDGPGPSVEAGNAGRRTGEIPDNKVESGVQEHENASNTGVEPGEEVAGNNPAPDQSRLPQEKRPYETDRMTPDQIPGSRGATPEIPLPDKKGSMSAATSDSGPVENSGDLELAANKEPDDLRPDPHARNLEYDNKPTVAGKETGTAGSESAMIPGAAGHQSDKPDNGIEPEGYYVSYAGLVLTWPYLARMFNNTGYLKGNYFLSDQTKERAVLLLGYIASGKTRIEEPRLLIPKLLCGCPLKMPVARSIRLTKNEKDTARSMLKGLIQNWAILKNTSVDGLRETFFDREGKLEQTEDHWKLIIEQKGTDILLDHLPYGISIIKLPWLKKLLKVDWA